MFALANTGVRTYFHRMTADTSCPERGVVFASLLAVSALLNIILAAGWMWPASFTPSFTPLLHLRETRPSTVLPSQQPPAGWSRRAAEAAEAAAIFNCSGNGDLYVDTVDDPDTIRSMAFPSTDGNYDAIGIHQGLACECYECFAGPRCAELIPDCVADVQSGDPLLFAPFWKQNAEESAIVIPAWYRMGYAILESGNAQLTPALEREIRALHSLVGNAVVENKYIIIGVGTTLLLNAAVASLSPPTGTPANVVSAAPYYQAYREQTKTFENSHYIWAGDANFYAEQQSMLNESSIEFVNFPNNPDSSLRVAVLNGSNASTIYDLVYYWPHFTAITTSLDHDVMLFSLSKVTGHAGSRLGWAIVKDYSVYTRMLNHVEMNVLSISHESQLRATQLLHSINKAYFNQLHSKQKLPLGLPPLYYATKGLSFHFAYAILQDRWRRLSSTLQTSQRLELQDVESNYCNFFKEELDPSPAYAWIHCKQGTEEECQSLFIQGGISVRNGSMYGANSWYARLSLIKRDSVFENLLQHLSVLVSREISNISSSYHNAI